MYVHIIHYIHTFIPPLKAVFLYFMLNLLWIVATFFLQAIGSEVISIKIPKLDPRNNSPTGEYMLVEPLSLMFLLSFAVLLLVQFLAMLYHRYVFEILYGPTVHCVLITFDLCHLYEILHNNTLTSCELHCNMNIKNILVLCTFKIFSRAYCI